MHSTVTSAIDHIGLTKIGNRFGIWPSGVQKWRDRGCLPQTDLSGLTEYAKGIAELSEGKWSAEQLLEDTRAAWVRLAKKRGKPKRIGRNG